EQTYLQGGMYQDPLIKFVAQMGILDKMRFITFNGEKQRSFYDWCKQTKCQTTSFDLEKRIEFDRFAIEKEASLTWWSVETLRNRLLKTRANEIALLTLEELN